MDNNKPKIELIARWACFLPVAILASLASSIALSFVGRYSLMMFVGQQPDEDSGFFLHIEYFVVEQVIPAGAMGFVFVYCGTKIAPSQNHIIAVSLAGACLILAGAMALSVVAMQQWIDLVTIAAFCLGSCGIAAELFREHDNYPK